METYDATNSHEEGRFFRRETDEQAEGKRILGPRQEGTRTLMEAAGITPEDEQYIIDRLAEAEYEPEDTGTVVYTIQKDDGTIVQSEVLAEGELPLELDPALAEMYPMVPLPKKRPMTRRDIRTKILQATYAVELEAGDADEIFALLLADDYRLLLDNIEAQADSHFFFNLFYKNIETREQSIELIRPRLENWDVQRIALIDRIVLQLGICELLHFEDIPVRVTINEYIELAKTFSTDRSGQFVNGLLDSIYHDLLIQGRVIKAGRGLTGARPDEIPFLQGHSLAPGETQPYIPRREYGYRDPDRGGEYRRRTDEPRYAQERPYEPRPYDGERRYRQDYGSNPSYGRNEYEQRPRGEYPPRPRGEYPPRPRGEYPPRPRNEYEQRPRGEYPPRPRNEYEQRPRGEYPPRPRNEYPPRPRNEYEQHPRNEYEQHPRNEYEQRLRGEYEQRLRGEYEQRPRNEYEQRLRGEYEQRPRGEYEQPARPYSQRSDFNSGDRRDYTPRGETRYGENAPTPPPAETQE